MKRKISKRHFTISSILTGAILSFGLMGNANAHCTWGHPGHCFEEVGNAIADTTKKVVNDIAGTTTNVADDAANWTETAVTNSVSTMGDGLKEAGKAIEGAATSAYTEGAKLMYQQVGTPMNNMANAWKNLASSEPAKYQRLVNAIQANDGPEIKTALEDVLVSMYTYAGFGSIVQDFKDKNAGSLMLFVSAGGGAGVTLEGDIGLAIDIDYLVHLANRVANGHSSSSFSGAIGSLFSAVGLQIGPAAGGGVDFVVGYHTSNPDGVYGPGLDISLEIKATAGGGIGFSYDLSQAPWQIVMGSIGIGAGVEVQISAGPSYTFVIGQLCSNGSFKEFANQCPTSSNSTTTASTASNNTSIKNYWKSNEFLNVESGAIASSGISGTSSTHYAYNAHIWVATKVTGTNFVRFHSAFAPASFLNTETGYLQVTPIWDSAHSAMWEMIPVPGVANTYRIRNRWTGGYLHREYGSIQVGNIWATAQSGWWVFDNDFALVTP